MYKLLIVDDEPIVRIALTSILDWPAHEIEICGSAANGKQALEIIETQHPDIVICDIKMPVMSGLELAKTCRERFGELPLFIMLTSYEEFSYAQEAIRYHVIDYLVKLEMNEDTLLASINKAKDQLSKLVPAATDHSAHTDDILPQLRDKFFIRLIHNLFEDEAHMMAQAAALGITHNASSYTAVYCEITHPAEKKDLKQLMTICESSVNMFSDLISKYLKTQLVTLDINHFAIIFFFDPETEKDNCPEYIKNALVKTSSMITNYFGSIMLFSVGPVVCQLNEIAASYRDARQTASLMNEKQNIVFCSEIEFNSSDRNVFHMSLFKDDIERAFLEYDTERLIAVFDTICQLLSEHPTHTGQAVDAACNVLYLAMTFLPDGNEVISDIFKNESGGYGSIHTKTQVAQVTDWMNILKNGLVNVLTERRKNYKNKTVTLVKEYISEHLTDRLSLSDVADTFGLSSSYLSTLFKKYTDIGFSEYVTKCRIDRAKELMEKDPTLKVYEVADMLNFDNAFYFSKVFKKQTGRSPKDFLQGE